MTITLQNTRRILLLHETAKRNGALVAVREILPMLPEGMSEQEFTEALATSKALGSMFELRSGYLTEKGDRPSPESAVGNEVTRRRLALEGLEYARRFSPLLKRGSALVTAASGSLSYGSSSGSDDLDFFLVTRGQTLWIELMRSLLLARAFRLVNRNSPQVCFSCVLDEDYAHGLFAAKQDPLFARDALQAVVLDGREHYGKLLEEAHWISEIYPDTYLSRVGSETSALEDRATATALSVVLNRFLYVLAGSYVRVKSFIRNMKLRKQGRFNDIFVAKIGSDHLVYESLRYQKLRRTYLGAFSEADRSSSGPVV